jgi:hypothetical protein
MSCSSLRAGAIPLLSNLHPGAGAVLGNLPKEMSCSISPSLRAGTFLLLRNLLQKQELIQVTVPRRRRSYYR